MEACLDEWTKQIREFCLFIMQKGQELKTSAYTDRITRRPIRSPFIPNQTPMPTPIPPSPSTLIYK